MITPSPHNTFKSIPALLPPSGVHNQTTSYNPLLFHHYAAAPLRHLITKICQIDPWPELTRLFGINSRYYCDKIIGLSGHPATSPNAHLLLFLYSSFTQNCKHCSLTNPVHPLPLSSSLSELPPPTICGISAPPPPMPLWQYTYFAAISDD